jgi:hypothetical protein
MPPTDTLVTVTSLWLFACTSQMTPAEREVRVRGWGQKTQRHEAERSVRMRKWGFALSAAEERAPKEWSAWRGTTRVASVCVVASRSARSAAQGSASGAACARGKAGRGGARVMCQRVAVCGGRASSTPS